MAKRLFTETEITSTETTMVWVSSSSSVQSKTQKDFLTTLRKHQELIKKTQQVDGLLAEATKIYTEEITPEHDKQDELDKEKFEVMFDIYINDVLNLKEKIKEDFRSMLLHICHENSKDPKYTHFYYQASLKLETLAEKKEREYEMKKAERQMKSEMGIDIDMEEMANADFNNPETVEKLKAKYKDFFEKQQAEFHQQQNEEFDFEKMFGGRRFERKKTAKQIEKEKKEKEVEDLLNKDINKLFKELAKVIHPDREQDPTLRDKKENLMKQLSNARDNMNIGEILYIKMLIDDLVPENGIETAFNDDSIKRFVKIIKAKITELENSNVRKLVSHPLFVHLAAMEVKRYILPLEKNNLKLYLKNNIKNTKAETTLLQNDLAELKSNPKLVKGLIKDYQQEQNNMIDLDDLAEMFSSMRYR